MFLSASHQTFRACILQRSSLLTVLHHTHSISWPCDMKKFKPTQGHRNVLPSYRVWKLTGWPCTSWCWSILCNRCHRATSFWSLASLMSCSPDAAVCHWWWVTMPRWFYCPNLCIPLLSETSLCLQLPWVLGSDPMEVLVHSVAEGLVDVEVEILPTVQGHPTPYVEAMEQI